MLAVRAGSCRCARALLLYPEHKAHELLGAQLSAQDDGKKTALDLALEADLAQNLALGCARQLLSVGAAWPEEASLRRLTPSTQSTLAAWRQGWRDEAGTPSRALTALVRA